MNKNLKECKYHDSQFVCDLCNTFKDGKFITINIYNNIGYHMCSFDDAKRIFDGIIQLFDLEYEVCLDFKNIKIITIAFLNECIGKLYGKYDASFIKDNLTVINMEQDYINLTKMCVDNAKKHYKKNKCLNVNIKKHILSFIGIENETRIFRIIKECIKRI